MQETQSYLVPIPLEWPVNNIYQISIAEKNICISKLENTYYGYTDVCPHAGVLLSESGSLVKECIIVCPLHGYKFNIKNGRNITDEGYKLKTYLVKPYSVTHLEIFLY